MALMMPLNLTLAVLLGLLGPLVATATSRVLVERTWRRNRDRLTALMLGAFVAKMLFFGGYVVIMLQIPGVRLRPVPFVASFTGCLIALYGIEALYLRRLFAR